MSSSSAAASAAAEEEKHTVRSFFIPQSLCKRFSIHFYVQLCGACIAVSFYRLQVAKAKRKLEQFNQIKVALSGAKVTKDTTEASLMNYSAFN